MEVGIRELKAHLSEYVERASGGEIVRITDRGRPRAVLMPLPASDRVAEGLAEGWLAREVDEPLAQVEPVKPPPGRSTHEILSDDRGIS
jgi:prevent-host-death family protein